MSEEPKLPAAPVSEVPEKEITEDFDSGKPDIVTEMVSDIYDLEKTSEEEADEEEARALYDLQDLGNGDGFTNGVFYEEDRDEDDVYE